MNLPLQGRRCGARSARPGGFGGWLSRSRPGAGVWACFGRSGSVPGPGPGLPGGFGFGLGRLRQRVEDGVAGSLDVAGIMAVGGREVAEPALEPDDRHGEVGDRGEVAGGVPGADSAPVLVVGEVLDVMEPGLEAPVVAHQGVPGRGVGAPRLQRGQAMGEFLGDLPGLEVGAQAVMRKACRRWGRSQYRSHSGPPISTTMQCRDSIRPCALSRVWPASAAAAQWIAWRSSSRVSGWSLTAVIP